MDLYREEIIDHYKNPRNFGSMDDADVRIFEVNTLCGDNIELFLKIKDGKIADVKFRSLGCAISTASASMLTEFIKSKALEDVRNLKEEDILEFLGGEIAPARKKCAFLPLIALKKAVADQNFKSQLTKSK